MTPFCSPLESITRTLTASISSLRLTRFVTAILVSSGQKQVNRDVRTTAVGAGTRFYIASVQETTGKMPIYSEESGVLLPLAALERFVRIPTGAYCGLRATLGAIGGRCGFDSDRLPAILTPAGRTACVQNAIAFCRTTRRAGFTRAYPIRGIL
jgi:hypothetical protein